MSLASAPQDAWTRFDKEAQLPNLPPKKSVQIQEDEQGVNAQEGEKERTPSPTPQTPVVRITEPDSPELGPAEVSTVNDRELDEVEDEDMEMATPLKKTERWRENVEDAMYDEEEEELVSKPLPLKVSNANTRSSSIACHFDSAILPDDGHQVHGRAHSSSTLDSSVAKPNSSASRASGYSGF